MDARTDPRRAAQEGALTLGLSAACTTLRMETVAGTFDPLLMEALAHMFRLDKGLPRVRCADVDSQSHGCPLDRKTTKEYKRLQRLRQKRGCEMSFRRCCSHGR